MADTEPRFRPKVGPRSDKSGDVGRGKSYLHRQRVSEQPGVERTPKEKSGQSSQAEASSHASPETPDQTELGKPPKTVSNSPSAKSKRRAAKAAALAQSHSKDSSQASANVSASSSLDRVPCGDIITDVPYPSSSRNSKMASSKRPAVMTTQDSIKMQGQDTLEVRNVTMPNGQSASLVLEDGKLQRIVCSSGNVVEVWWHGNKLKSKEKGGGPDRQMAIKLRTATYPSKPEVVVDQSSNQGVMKKLVNSLHSQRLSSANLHSAAYPAVLGPFTQSEQHLRTVQSLDMTDPRRRRGLSKSPRGPSNQPSRTASHNDMSTILEIEGRRRSGDTWNPMSSSWLPTDMTSGKQESGRRTAEPVGQQAHLKTTGAAPMIGTPITPPTVIKPPQPTSPVAKSKEKQPSPKKKLWKSIKKLLHIPSSKKEKATSPKSKDAAAEGTDQVGEMTAAERDRQIIARWSSPAVPSVATTRGAGLPSPESKLQAPSEASAGAQSHDRMSRSSSSITTVRGATPEEKLAAYVLPSTASSPAIPVANAANDLSTRQYRFGPTTENRHNLANVGSDTSAGEAQQRRAALRTPSALGNSQRDSALVSRSRAPPATLAPKPDPVPKQRVSLAGYWQRNFTEGTSGAKVDDLLNVSSLQRLAREKTMEMQIVETDETFELRWHIPLNGSSSKISKVDRYLKSGEVVESARRDGRSGVLRSQLTFTPEGHVHIRALQGAPYSAVFHDRLKLSSGGRRIKIEQKFQLLEAGVPPVKHFSIWNRME